MGGVPTTGGGGAKRVDLPDGRGAVFVRRVTQTKMIEIEEMVDKPGARPELTRAKAGVLALRWAITGAEDLKDFASGEGVEFATERHHRLGAIASQAVLDSLSQSAMEAVSGVAFQTEALPEAQQGN